LPTKEEWVTLCTFLGGNSKVYNAIKVGGSSGFNVLLTGRCTSEGCDDHGEKAYFWSSTASGMEAVSFYCEAGNYKVALYDNPVDFGFSVRLFRDN